MIYIQTCTLELLITEFQHLQLLYDLQQIKVENFLCDQRLFCCKWMGVNHCIRKTWRPTCSQRIRVAQSVHQWLSFFFFVFSFFSSFLYFFFSPSLLPFFLSFFFLLFFPFLVSLFLKVQVNVPLQHRHIYALQIVITIINIQKIRLYGLIHTAAASLGGSSDH